MAPSPAWITFLKEAPVVVVAFVGLLFVIWRLFILLERKELNLKDLTVSINDYAIGQAKLITLIELLIQRRGQL